MFAHSSLKHENECRWREFLCSFIVIFRVLLFSDSFLLLLAIARRKTHRRREQMGMFPCGSRGRCPRIG
jgi:hypothetical protein